MESDGQKVTLEFDTSIYCLEAIKNASYDFTDRADITIKTLSSQRIQVCLRPLDARGILEVSLASSFTRNVLDHQVRLDVAKDYKLIREMIVAQAFEPVDNLKQVMGTVKP
jgi:His-Xaa-Ser system protein HxsD